VNLLNLRVLELETFDECLFEFNISGYGVALLSNLSLPQLFADLASNNIRAHQVNHHLLILLHDERKLRALGGRLVPASVEQILYRVRPRSKWSRAMPSKHMLCQIFLSFNIRE
jgi:hypothetical protein